MPGPGRTFLPSAAVLLALAACSAPPPPQPPDYVPRRVVEVQRWQVAAGERSLGWVVLLEIQDRDGPLRFYRILDEHGQWVGHATGQGRFSRRVPFRDDEEDLGIWPMREGVARLLEASGGVELRPVAAEADLRRTGR